MTFISGAAQDNLSRPPIIPFRILFYHRLYLLQSAIFTTLSNTSIGGYVAADMTALLSEVQRLMAKGSVTLSAVAEHGSDNYRSISSAYRTESAHFRGNENSGSSSSSRCKGENQSSAVKISSEESHSIQIQDLLMRAFERAMTVVTPSCLRGLTTQLPDVRTFLTSPFHT